MSDDNASARAKRKCYECPQSLCLPECREYLEEIEMRQLMSAPVWETPTIGEQGSIMRPQAHKKRGTGHRYEADGKE